MKNKKHIILLMLVVTLLSLTAITTYSRYTKTVSKTGKSITLEPMGAYERKVIHTKLQDSKYVTTHSIGEEPNRRVVISKK